ncbi:nickel/cobalt transporter [Falsirhodobacter sp. 1013]|uniref:nickel/cobalt transporter n=1 Tax=Falsirhodobacter sp. 1013 TaxID=3417566 RepID=UPI003EBFC53E
MRLTLSLLAALVLAAGLVLLGDHYVLAASGWASQFKFRVQSDMAAVIRAIKAGEPAAFWTLIMLSGSYGFLHALGPGHGKVLLGGSAIGSAIRPLRMFAVGAAASLAQALSAILLVLVTVNLLSLTSQQASAVAEGAMSAVSRIAILVIGGVLVWRGVKALRQAGHRHHAHCGCGHAHSPTAQDVVALGTPRDIAALILSVAARPCTGAIFLLVITWHLGIPVAGICGVLAMGFGTAFLNSLAIGGGLAARRVAGLGARMSGIGALRTAGLLQVAAGGAVIGLSALAVV